MSLSYTHRQRTGLSLTQPNSSPWAQSHTYDRMHRLTNLTSSAGAFASEYYSGASTLLRKLTQPSGAFVTNAYDSGKERGQSRRSEDSLKKTCESAGLTPFPFRD